MLQYLFLSYFIGMFIFGFVFFKYFYFLEIQCKLIMSIFWLMVVSVIFVLLFAVTFIDFNLNEVRRFLKIFKQQR